MKKSFTLSATFLSTPEILYAAWLDGDTHAATTGGEPANGSDEIGGHFSAWDGYIEGKNLELEPAKRIVQSWRTTEFEEGDPDSQIEILLEPVADGTKLTLIVASTQVPGVFHKDPADQIERPTIRSGLFRNHSGRRTDS